MTNLIPFLHITAKYYAAAMQLMVNEANVTAKQLELNETVTVPTVAVTNAMWSVDHPSLGMGGDVSSSNYTFSFHEGKLRSISKTDWITKVSPPAKTVVDLAGRPSLLDTNSAYQLATQRLAALSVDVASLEKRLSPKKNQLGEKHRLAVSGTALGSREIGPIPVYLVAWGGGRESRDSVFVQFLGTTKEMVTLGMGGNFALNRPPLVLTNVEELLGPMPPPQFFVEELVGGKEVYAILENPEEVEIALLSKLEMDTNRLSTLCGSLFKPKVDRVGPIKLKPEAVKAFTDSLLSFDSYLWGISNDCMSDFGARLKFKRGTNTVEVLLCYECDMVEIKHGFDIPGPQPGHFDNAHGKLVKAIQDVFPQDQIIRDLKPSKEQ
ncbi:MAG: hypothetical protein JWM68_3202 [Verrucomicrobiales bacterium]|nr:hypothetical protein [Verrucomicrobiales bacterium]